MFIRAEKTNTSIKLGVTGPSGSGKSYSALRLARGLVGPSGKIAVIDTENGSAKLYSDLTEFYHLDLHAPYEYQKFMEAIKEAEASGFDAIVIDSLSHLWQGILEEKNSIDRRGGNQYTNWTEPTKHLNETLYTILQSNIHVIACMRVKTEYVIQEETNQKGKTVSVPKKVGLSPIMRDGIEYEFTSMFEVGMDHNATTSKDRTGLFVDRVFQIDEGTGERIACWLAGMSDTTETERFVSMIHSADSKDTLSVIGAKIKESTLPEQEKGLIREVYRKKYSSLA